MSSKRNVKVNKCKHVFKQGLKSGKKCNRNCRGDYCKDHNKHREEYNKKIYDDKVIENKSDINAKAKSLLRRINKATCKEDLPEKLPLEMQFKVIEDKCRIVINRFRALQVLAKKITIDDILSKDGNLVMDKVNREINYYEKRRIKLKNGKTKTKKRVLSDEDIKHEISKLMRRKPLLLEELNLWKKIIKSYESKEEKFGIIFGIKKELEEISNKHDVEEQDNEYQMKVNELSNIFKQIINKNCDYASTKITEDQKNELINMCRELKCECDNYIDKWKDNKESKHKLKPYITMTMALKDNVHETLKRINKLELAGDELIEEESEDDEVIEI